MKKILKLLMFCWIFTMILGISVLAADVPDEIEKKGSQFYIKPHAFDQDNFFTLYFDGQILYADLEFDDVTEYQFSIRNTDTGSWVHTEGIIHEDKPLISVDFSSFPNGNYMIRLFYNTTGNVYDDGYHYKDYAAMKTWDNVCSFKEVTGGSVYRLTESVYHCITKNDYWYFTEYLVPSETSEQYALFKPVVDEVIQGLTSDYDKARAIYTWITENIYYDYPAFRSGNLNDAANATFVMKNRRGVCSGYAKVTDIMMHMAGIPSIYQSGKCGTIGHAWNIVCIDGTWCYVDTTWGSANKYGYDNDESFVKGKMNYQYFATTAGFLSSSHRLEPYFSNVVINGIEYSIPYYPSTGENAAIIVDCHNKTSDTVVIPPSIGQVTVTELDEKCFYNDDNVKNIYIPETVTRIDYSAFRSMDNLNIFVLGKNTPINNVYYDCNNMTIYMPFSSPHFLGVDAYTKCKVVNTDYEIKEMSHSTDTFTFTLHNGMFKNNPKLIVGLYDNEGRQCKTMMQQTNPNTTSYIFDSTGYGVSYTAKAFLMDTANNLNLYCDPYKKRIAHIEDSGVTLESFHKYLNDDDETLTYIYPGTCHSLDVTFNSQTFVAENDYIHIYDAKDTLIGTYTGDSLAGKTLNILGNTVKIRLVTNRSIAAYGYKTSSILVVKE